MLQRLALSDLDELDRQCGLWSRSELLAMDAAFCARVEAAFQSGRESRKAAAATVRVNGDARRVEAAIELAWRWLRENMEANVDISFSEVVAFVNARCPGVDRARIGVEIKRRFTSWVSREPRAGASFAAPVSLGRADIGRGKSPRDHVLG